MTSLSDQEKRTRATAPGTEQLLLGLSPFCEVIYEGMTGGTTNLTGGEGKKRRE